MPELLLSNDFRTNTLLLSWITREWFLSIFESMVSSISSFALKLFIESMVRAPPYFYKYAGAGIKDALRGG